MKKKFTFLIAALMLLMMILPGKAVGQTFKRISSSSTLSDGDQIIFVNQDEDLACSTTQNSNNRGTVSISTSSNKYTKTNSDNVQVFTIKINDAGKYGFHTGSGYLYSKSSTKNQINTNSDAITTAPSGTSAWTFDGVSSNVFTFKNVSNTSYYLAFNESNNPPLFSQYSSGYVKPYIYEIAYTVTYNAGGGTGTMTDTNSPYTSGETVSLMDNTFTRDDYEFSGWLVKDELNNEVTVTEGHFTMPRGNVTVIAQWTPATTDPYFDVEDVDLVATATSGTIAYKVSNSVSGGKISATCTAGGSWISAVTVTDEDSDDNTVTFTTSVNAEDERIGTIRLTYTYDSDKTKTADVTITQAIAQYTVTYNANDGTTEDVVITYDYGTDVTVFDYDDDEIGFTPPTGKRFKNWKENSTTYDAGDEISSIDANHILVAQWEDLPTYSLVTSEDVLICGKHYIIVGSRTVSNQTKNFAMGSQGSNNRSAVEVAIDNNTIEAVTGICEFVISGPETIKKNNQDVTVYTIYDVAGNGYLYAAGSGSGSNYLRTETTLDDNGKWTITIGATTNVATITAQGSNSNNKLKKNNSSDIFSCYGSGQNDVYLYVKDGDNDCHIYSNTTPGYNLSVSGDMNIHSGVVTVESNKTLTVNGQLVNSTAANLIIEDGGQLVCSNDVAATLQKSVTHYTSASSIDGWYTIASPVVGTDMSSYATGTYDLFKYDEANHLWKNIKNNGSEFTSTSVAEGFLYANGANQTLPFAGTMKASNKKVEIPLEWSSTDGKLKGFNLVGNPFTCNITPGMIIIDDDDNETVDGFSTYYVSEGNANLKVRTLSAEHPIKPGQGFFVQAEKANSKLIFNPSGVSKGEMDYKPTFISIEAGNTEFTDNAYIQLGYGNTLRKMSINDNTPLVYVMNDGADYAAATVDELKGSMPVCFKAAATGQYTISVNTEGLDMSYLHLIDRLTGEDVNLLLEPTYSFIATKGDNESRFILSFTANCFNDSESETFAYQAGNDIFVSGEGELQIFDVTGRLVSTTNVNGVETINVPSSGMYIFRLVGTEVKTQKIVVR